MTDTTVHFPNLNNSNYAEWSVRMEAILVRWGLWPMVKIPISGTLEHVHRAAGFATSLALWQHFLTAKKVAGQSMQAWIGHIQGLAFRMEQSGVEVSDQDKILALTMGLPPSYDPVIINFDATLSKLLTLNNIIAHLLNEEVRQSGDSNIAKDPEDEVMAVTSGKGHGARNTAGADVTYLKLENLARLRGSLFNPSAHDNLSISTQQWCDANTGQQQLNNNTELPGDYNTGHGCATSSQMVTTHTIITVHTRQVAVVAGVLCTRLIL
ncbi:uncharacterized protein LACBIDRAFT_325924 [Laccaria bicolor S238N-H82]|uniref:Predicted protein n=1 Tax=Laccaria bicolor (strain S238N-H82 / ATCC MYA-4686) TaxID=486041 RepID=B0D6P6_LACBS|nr:uncharacterized protein LACBIDRAFT_325924 [Laccaria bicolor S238N-H82]EDR09511.1 predicted protein [Laccaria bicolor S238N-H82]|eukprot:XP_001879860.1 predicted protein [Laccaria bicolor S238N-H82]